MEENKKLDLIYTRSFRDRLYSFLFFVLYVAVIIIGIYIVLYLSYDWLTSAFANSCPSYNVKNILPF